MRKTDNNYQRDADIVNKMHANKSNQNFIQAIIDILKY